jgi:hypothetical protein
MESLHFYAFCFFFSRSGIKRTITESKQDPQFGEENEEKNARDE